MEKRKGQDFFRRPHTLCHLSAVIYLHLGREGASSMYAQGEGMGTGTLQAGTRCACASVPPFWSGDDSQGFYQGTGT